MTNISTTCRSKVDSLTWMKPNKKIFHWQLEKLYACLLVVGMWCEWWCAGLLEYLSNITTSLSLYYYRHKTCTATTQPGVLLS